MVFTTAGGGATQETGYEIDNSLRFNYPDNPQLSFTPSSDGNKRVATASFWLKRGVSRASNDLHIMGSQEDGSNLYSIRIRSSGNADVFQFLNAVSGSTSNGFTYKSTAAIRDHSAWYHFVFVYDKDNSTAGNRGRIYVNGVEETLFGTESNFSDSSTWNSTNTNNIGNSQSAYFDGYMAEVNLVDGLALDPTYFAETKNGVWIAKEYTGSYGTNGFRLQFNQTGTGTASASTIGADTSGNTHHFTSSGIVASDCAMPDSPENNFCTLNSVGRRYGQSYVGTFSEGNLKVASGGNATNVFGTMAINQIASQGGVYFEVRMDSLDTNRTYFGVIGDNGTNNKSAAHVKKSSGNNA